MNIIIFGAGGFIGKNLTLKLAENTQNQITVIDKSKKNLLEIEKFNFKNVVVCESTFNEYIDFDFLLKNQDVVYHLISTTVPVTSNQHIEEELFINIISTVRLIESCIKSKVKKIIFFSSGGTVYGKDVSCPINEESQTYPICSYGLQKMTIEKLLYLYHHMHGIDYRIIRLSNPYGPYQKPDGLLGAVTTFTYKALKKEKITVYGDGNIIRDFIYVDDAIRAIECVSNGESKYRLFNIGCGYGTSINELLDVIKSVLNVELDVIYKSKRKVDVPVNYLDISRYENTYGKLNPISLSEGVSKTANFIKQKYGL